MVDFNPKNVNIQTRTAGVGTSAKIRGSNGYVGANRTQGASVAGSMQKSIFNMNRMRGISHSSTTTGTSATTSTSSGNTLLNVLAYTSAGLGLVGSAIGVVGAIRDSKADGVAISDTVPFTIQTSPNTSAAAISGLNSAKDLTSLSGAIDIAQTSLTNLGTDETYLKDLVSSFKEEDVQNFQNIKNDYKDTYATKDKELSNANKGVYTAEQGKAEAEKGLANASDATKTAKADYDSACNTVLTKKTAVTQAKATLSGLQTQLAGMQEKIPQSDANGEITYVTNLQYTQLQEQIRQADAKVTTAKDQLKEAESAKDSAKTALQNREAEEVNAGNIKEGAITAYTNAQDNLETAETVREDAKVKLQQAEDNYKQAEIKLKQLSTAKKQLQQVTSQKEKLEGKIHEAQIKMEKLREKNETKLDNSNSSSKTDEMISQLKSSDANHEEVLAEQKVYGDYLSKRDTVEYNNQNWTKSGGNWTNGKRTVSNDEFVKMLWQNGHRLNVELGKLDAAIVTG